jgi:hypothetical protein
LQSKSIHIVSLVWYKILPAQFGGQQTIAAFNNALGKEVQLTCLCSKNNVQTGNENFEVYPLLPTSKWQFINPLTWWFIYQFIKKEKATHVIAEHPYHVIASWLLHTFLKINIIHYSHNIEYERFKFLGKPYWRILFLAEYWICRFAKLNIFVTEQDKITAIKQFNLIENNCLVIPHPVTIKDFSNKEKAIEKIKAKHAIPHNHNIFLFNGTLDYAPNALAVEAIATQLIPELNKINNHFTFIITGRIEDKNYQHLFNLATEQLIITGKVENVADYFLAANVYVNAVSNGGGVQTKTLEALSYHLNVVCFEHMLNGIEMQFVEDKIFIVSINNWQQFAQTIFTALTKEVSTPPAFFEHYSYEKYLPEFLNRIN